MMANGGYIARDTLFGPERNQARAIDWDLSDCGIHQGAQQRCTSDAVYMAAPDQTPALTDPHLPSGRHPYMVRVTMANDLALKESDLSPRELAVQFTDTERYFVSEASVYRILKSYDLITSPAYVVVSAADEFRDKTTRLNQLWQTDFTYLKVIGWGWFYLSTILDDYSRYIIAWKLCTTMKTGDVTDTLDLALQTSGCDQATVIHKPRLLSDNGASYISGELADWLEEQKMDHVRGAPYHPQTQGKIEPLS